MINLKLEQDEINKINTKLCELEELKEEQIRTKGRSESFDETQRLDLNDTSFDAFLDTTKSKGPIIDIDELDDLLGTVDSYD